jgi:hypothetical protein
MANIMTAEFAVTVVTEVAVAVAELASWSVLGSTSNGPPDKPSAFKPPVTVAPEKATIEPIAMSAREFGKVKEKEPPSVPSATRYRTVPCQALLPLPVPSERITRPSIRVQPVEVTLFKPPLSLSVSF